MRAIFSSRDVDNHTAFIRIKTNAANEDQYVVIPVEVEVTSGGPLNPSLSDHFYIYLLGYIKISIFNDWLQLLVYTPPQRCLTLVHFDHKVGPVNLIYSISEVKLLTELLSSRYRSPKAAESSSFKFRTKRRTHHSMYRKALLLHVSSWAAGDPLFCLCSSECTHNSVEWSHHSRLQSCHAQSWRK